MKGYFRTAMIAGLLAYAPLPALSAAHLAAAGSGHSLVLDGDGQVWGWGYNKYGTLGDGSTLAAAPYAQTSARRAAIADVASVAAGQGYVIAVKNDGSVWTWGYGYLGHGAYEGKSSPTEVAGIGNIKQTASGLYHTLAVSHGGKLYAWGNNSRGTVGDGSTTHRATPVALSSLTDVATLAASGHSLAVKRDGSVWAWGENDYGQAGGSAGQISTTPRQIAGLAGIAKVAAGRRHSLALQDDGTLWAWGIGIALGDGNGKDSSVPVKVSGLSGVTAIAAGEDFSVALKSDGTVWVFGVYEFSLSGSRMVSFTPRQIANLSDITAIGAGFYHALAVKRDGTVLAWGLNDVGQLGNGQSGNVATTPASVITEKGTLALAAPSAFDASADRLFNWAESAYPTLFPSHGASRSTSGYYYRCYAGDRCLGEKGGEIYYFDGKLQGVGRLDALLDSSAKPAGF